MLKKNSCVTSFELGEVISVSIFAPSSKKKIIIVVFMSTIDEMCILHYYLKHYRSIHLSMKLANNLDKSRCSFGKYEAYTTNYISLPIIYTFKI